MPGGLRRAAAQAGERADQRFAGGAGRVVDRFAALGLVDQVVQVVVTVQQRRQGGRFERQPAVARLGQEGLDGVREMHDVGESEDTRRSLDGVRGAKDRVELFARVALAGQRLQSLFHAGEQVAAFDEEDGKRTVKVDGGTHGALPLRPAPAPVRRPARRAARCRPRSSRPGRAVR